MPRAALAVVGIGICCGTDLAANARKELEEADDVFYLAPDRISRAILLDIKPDAVSFGALYGHDIERADSYAAMVERVLERLRADRRVCFAIPGHPGVFAFPTHEAIRRARAEGFDAVMLPALSAADHLYADVGIDPGESGSWSFDATEFIVYGRCADPTVALMLWQIGAIGELHNPREVSRRGLRVLTEVLLESYSALHEVIVYEAAWHPIFDPLILRVPLAELPKAAVTAHSTLYVPPARAACAVADRAARLGLLTVVA